MRTKKPKADPFLETLRQSILSIVQDQGTSAADKLKAMEIGVKLYMVQHRVKGDDTTGKFFGS